MRIAIILGVLVLAGAAVWFLFFQNTPESFVEDFIKEVEYKGASGVDKKFLLEQYRIEPVLDWEECWQDASAKGLTREQYFDIWRDSFICDPEYLSMDASFPVPNALSYEVFVETFENLNFMDLELKNFEQPLDHVFVAVCYGSVKSDNALVNMVISGKQRIEIIGRHGEDGWKIVAFAIDQ